MEKFKSGVYVSNFLFPPRVEDFVPEGHLARIVDEIVDQLNTTHIEAQYSHLGQHAFHPKILLKVLFYGYATGTRSSRKLAARCETDTAYIFLARGLRPNFRVISDFRKDFIYEIGKLFVEIVAICQSLGMVKVGKIYIDGTKIRANAASRRTKNKKAYEKWLKWIDNEIKKILEEAERIDAQEDEEYGKTKRGDLVPYKLRKKQYLRAKIKEALKELRDETEKLNLTDKDAKFMKERVGVTRTNYNAQVAVTEDQIIVGAEITNSASDASSLIPLVEQVEENTNETPNLVVTDSGCASLENYEYLAEEKKIVPLIPDKTLVMKLEGKLSKDENRFHRGNFIYDEKNNQYICPAGERLILYKETEIEMHGKRLKILRYKTDACKECPYKSKCCNKTPFRIITRDAREGIVDWIRKLLLSTWGKKEYLKRMYTVEPIFGTLKRGLGYTHFLLRTLPKVKCEFQLMCIAFNIRKIWKYKQAKSK